MTLSVNNMTVAYGRSTVINDVSFGPLRGGNVVGLIGPNGAGKSTLVKAIAGIKRPVSGTVSMQVRGHDVTGKERIQAVGYVPQDMLTSATLTAFESVMVSARDTVQRGTKPVEAAAAVMEQLGIIHLSNRLISDMSGGQRQLVGIAQMLVREPHFLLLDEPTSALDLKHQMNVLRIVRDVVGGTDKVALVAIHDLNLAARFCDELIVLKDGSAIAHDTPANVLTPDVLENVYGIRARVIDDAGVPVVCPIPEPEVHTVPSFIPD